MDAIEKYFKDGRELNGAATVREITDLEKRLGTNFPDDYKSFLTQINGFEGTIGKSYVRLHGVEEIEECTLSYCSEFYPDKICIGTDGGGELFVIEKTNRNQKYGVVPAIGDTNDYIELGDTLDKFLRRLSDGLFPE